MGSLGGELALLRTVVEALGEIIIITDSDWGPSGPRIQYVNPAFTRLTGYAAHAVLGQTPRILQGPNTDRTQLNALRAAMAAGRSFRGETINSRKDGTEYLIEWLITPVVQGGRVTQWAAVQRDVTELRRSQERQTDLIPEVNHRVNNSIAVMQSVASQTARTAQTMTEFTDAFEGRLRALACVHRLLARHQGPDILLRPGAAVALGMALNELTANAADHWRPVSSRRANPVRLDHPVLSRWRPS
jgi:PAS domain S-box-containing protein